MNTWKPDSETFNLPCHVRFRLASWEELAPGQRVWYYVASRRRPEQAHGPFRVVDLARGVLENEQGVRMGFKGSMVQLILPVEYTT